MSEVTTPSGKNKGIIAVVAIIVILAILYFVISGVVDSKVEAKVVETIDTIEQESDGDAIITYDSVDSSLFSNSATLSGVQVGSQQEGDIFRADSITVVMDGYTESERLPDTFSIAVENLQILNEELLAEMSSFAEIDYRDHPMDFLFGYEFDGGSNELETNLNWSTEGLSNFTHELTMSDVSGSWDAIQAAYQENQGDTDFTPAQTRAIESELQNIHFNRTMVRYENDGEVELILEAVAGNNGVSAETLKNQIMAGIEQQLGDSAMADEIRTFIENPEQLSVTIEPEAPLSMEELTQVSMMLMMGAAAEAAKTLGLTVDAN
ncbi:hypothetical protein [Marinobacter zhanjiangensis]|uniref:DUF945 domain-containing protein n=1 Tax=Marinobacter zhanjiangensis TaxID=578215 RepID=A0ABQ3BBH7_9GAMM|nr:hypothetical protein [Marinobacter zhanjiangensis]GGY82707.1 hypothetical protein GCM10007071_32750 [Marinobacter zhanjiangensis]